VNWWQRLVRKQQLERQAEEELQDLLERLVSDHVAAGMSEGEARREARLKFGGLDQVKEACRDAGGLAWIDAVTQDVRYAIRMYRKNLGVTTVALLTLALGIGANTAIFSIVDAVLLEPLPYPHSDRIVGIWERRPGGQPMAMTTLNYLDYATQSTVFEHIAATTGCCAYVMLGDGPAPERLNGLHVSPPYFDILGARAALGRTFLAGDDQPGRDHIVVLSHTLWASHFGSDATLVGRPIRLDGESYTVVGVMPENSPFDRTYTQIWLPLAFGPDRMNRRIHWLLSLTGGALVLPKPGVTLERARAEMETIAARLSAAYPNTNKG
jgi:hypothetical protein